MTRARRRPPLALREVHVPCGSPPTVIAQRYELQRMLAQGGMAEVWLAIDLTLDRKVAVKWLKPTLASDPW